MTDRTEPSSQPRELVREAVAAAIDRKAVDVRVLDLSGVVTFTDYFLVCSGTSERQVQAIAKAVQKRLRESGFRPLHEEGVRQGWWALLDYGDFVFHIFTREKRAYYGLEGLWADAPDVSAEFDGGG
jgi:ribosome-associated protein